MSRRARPRRATAAERHFEAQDVREQLVLVLATLSEREASVIRVRYGLINGVPRTPDEVGQVYGVTGERARQLEEKALNKIRSRSAVLESYRGVSFAVLLEEVPSGLPPSFVQLTATGGSRQVVERVPCALARCLTDHRLVGQGPTVLEDVQRRARVGR